VVVSALDSLGSERVRTITDSDGRYRLELEPGIWRVRVRRIGFKMQESASILLRRGEERTLDLEAPTRTVILPTMVISERARCGKDQNVARALDVLWEWVEASVFVTSAVAYDANAVAAWVVTEQTGYPGDRTRRLVHLESLAGQSRRVFAARDEGVLASEGFVIQDSGGVLVRAPDADLFLTRSFRARHCFGVNSSGGQDEDLIGLTFAPDHPPDGKVDVSGTLWMSKSGHALRRIEFAYVGLPPVDGDIEPGGWVAFDVLPDSTLFVRSWEIATPERFEVRRQIVLPDLAASNLPVAPTTRQRGLWHFVGGAVYAWSRGQRVLFGDNRGRVQLNIMEPDVTEDDATLAIGIADAPLRVVKSGETATIAFVPWGTIPVRREVRVFGERWSLDTIIVRIGDDRAPVRIAMPAVAVGVYRRCGHRRPSDRDFDLLLKVDHADAEAQVPQSIRAEWQDGFQIIRDGSQLSAQAKTVTVDVDGRGLALACALPRGRTVRLTLVEGDRSWSLGDVRADSTRSIVITRRASRGTTP
jgi:hypothetical protein